MPWFSVQPSYRILEFLGVHATVKYCQSHLQRSGIDIHLDTISECNVVCNLQFSGEGYLKIASCLLHVTCEMAQPLPQLPERRADTLHAMFPSQVVHKLL